MTSVRNLNTKKYISLFLAVLTALLLLSGCASTQEKKIYSSVHDFKGETVSLPTASVFDVILEDFYDGDITVNFYNDTASQVEALEKGQIAAIVTDKPKAASIVAANSGLVIFPETIMSDCYGFGFKKGSPLKAEFDMVIEEFKADGTLSALEEKWFSNDDSLKRIDFSAYDLSDRGNGVISYYCFTEGEPVSYINSDGKVIGFDAELVMMIADRLDMGIELCPSMLESLIMALEQGKADVIGGSISITQERREKIDFSESYYDGGITLVCRSDSIPGVQGDIELNSEDITLAVMTDNPVSDIVNEKYPKAKLAYINSWPDGMLALTAGNVDAFIEQRVTFDNAVASGIKGIHLHSDSPLGEPGIVAGGVSPVTDIPNAKELADKFLAEMKETGVLDDMYRRWVVEHDYTMPDIPQAENPAFTMRIGSSGLAEPYTFRAGEELTGYERELGDRFAAWAGARAEYLAFDWDSISAACNSGKVDYVFSNLYITPEREEEMILTDQYLSFDTVVIVRDAQPYTESETGFFASIKDSFEKTFIREGRWKLLLDGLWMTVKISLLSAVFGTVLGFILCITLRSGPKVLKAVVSGFSRVITGIPALVVLMIVYFVVFGRSGVPAETAGIVSFTVIFSVTVSGVLSAGINTIGAGQWEAAQALGLRRYQTFVRVIMPQALRVILPIYKGEFVSMMKLTSIVGYISIIDLTKAGDIVRSRTFEAFFPLLAVGAVYYLLARLFFAILDRIEIKLDPSRRPRTLPGDVKPVSTHAPAAVCADTDKGKEIIRLEHVKKVYELVTPLTDVNASIKRGEVITVIGPSGTGKSTLLRMLNRLEAQSEGKIYVFGQDTADKSTDMNLIRRRMGMVFQSFNLFDHLSVIENVMLAPVLLGRMSRQEAFEKGMQLLEAVGLAERAVNYPYELSGGQKQRVAIARALAMEPEVVLFDEPTSALDPGMVGEVLSVIKKLSRLGLTMIIVTHEMQFARDVSTRVFYMDRGVIYEDGSPEQIFDEPRRNRTRAFVNKLKTLPLVIESEKYDFIAMSQALEKFAQRNYLSRRRSENLVRCFEEVCAQSIVPHEGSGEKLHIFAEYSERNDELSLQFIWNGERFDPVEDGDDVSARLVKASCKSVSFAHEDGKNTLTLSGI